MDTSSLRLSLFHLGALKAWLHMPRFRLAIIYEQRVARLHRDCRIGDRQSIAGEKRAVIPDEAQYLRQRGDTFLERCRREWLVLHITGALLSGCE